jgi:hypothetical protein
MAKIANCAVSEKLVIEIRVCERDVAVSIHRKLIFDGIFSTEWLIEKLKDICVTHDICFELIDLIGNKIVLKPCNLTGCSLQFLQSRLFSLLDAMDSKFSWHDRTWAGGFMITRNLPLLPPPAQQCPLSGAWAH